MNVRAIAAAAAILLLCTGNWQRSEAAPTVPTCATNANVLGLSRIVEVDTADGPQFGRTPASEFSFLEDGEVILTFDDGPLRPYTEAVLNALDAHCTRATFFMVGRMAVADPGMVGEVARRGHTVAAHTWSHANLQLLDADKARDEIELGFSAVARAMGGPIAPFFRFPYLRPTPATLALLRDRHIAGFGIDIDPRDFEKREGAAVMQSVLAQLSERRKGIVLFHDIQPSTAHVLNKILDALKARGFKVVHVVPKEPATTLPEYDTLADREIARRKVASTKQPLAPRAVTWPQGDSVQAEDAAKPAETLPWATPATAAQLPANAQTSSAEPTKRNASASKPSGKKAAPWYEKWLLP